MSNTIEYTYDLQKFFIEFLLASEDTYVRLKTNIDHTYFDDDLPGAVKFINDFTDKFNNLPLIEHVVAETGIKFQKLDPSDINDQQKTWFLSEFIKFCRQKKLLQAIFSAPDKVEKGNFADIEKEIKEALLISLQSDLGLDYYTNPKERLQNMLKNQNYTSTGLKDLDYKLFGGFKQGELNLFGGNSGSGKSIFLQNILLNWSEQNKKVIYFTFELSQDLVALRLDTMITGFTNKTIYSNLDNLELKLKMLQRKNGNITIKYMPAGCTTNDLKAYLKEYEIQNGYKPDGVAIDYLDLMYPNSNKINPGDLFIKDKFVSEELRNLAIEYNMLMVSASQLGRTAITDSDINQSHVSGGISKINTCDNFIAIKTSYAMRQNGEYELHFLKTRSSNAVGSHIKIGFNIDSLRLFDLEKDESDFVPPTPDEVGKSILSKIKRT